MFFMKNVRIMGLFYFLAKSSKINIMLLATSFGISNGIISILLVDSINLSLHSNEGVLKFFLLLILMILTNALSSYLFSNLTENSLFSIRKSVVDSIISSDFISLESYGNEKIFSTLTQDVSVLSNAASLLPNLISSLSIIISCILYIFTISIGSGILLIISLLFGVISYVLITNPIMDLFSRNRKYYNVLYVFYTNLIIGNREARYNKVNLNYLYKNKFMDFIFKIRSNKLKISLIQSFTSSWGNLVVFAAIAVIIFVVPVVSNLDVSMVSSIVVVILFSLNSVYTVIGLYPSLINANISYNRIKSLEFIKEDFSEKK